MHEQTRIALSQIEAKAAGGRKVVLVSGNFNIVHPGHVRLLSFAADCGDVLVVAVNGNAPSPEFLGPELRLEAIKAIGIVDYAFILWDRLDFFLKALRPAVVVKGKEYEGRYNVEQEVLDGYGGQLLFGSGEATFSSLELIRREFVDVNPPAIQKPLDFAARHHFTLSDLHSLLDRLARLSVTVIGDLIVDEYIACDPIGMSQEDPTIVVTPVLSERFVGGAGIVAAHAKGIGANVNLVTVTGDDEVAEFATARLKSHKVTPHLFRDDSRPTTLKQRYRASGKTLLRVSHLRQHGISQDLQERILRTVSDLVKETDLVAFSDFNYGVLPQPMVEAISAMCAANGVVMVADSQSSSQIGDVSRFKGMRLLKPTEREARLALRDFDSGLVVLAEKLRCQAGAENIILTLGQEGLLIHAPASTSDDWITDKLPAFNNAPKDTAGAGDSLLICASLALVAGASIWQSAYIGSLAAACQVGRVGNLPLSIAELRAEIEAP